MSIVTILILLLLGLTVGYAVVMFQIVTLARLHRSTAWWVGAGTFVLSAGKAVKGLVRLPAAIIEAQMKGYMVTRLTGEQWLDVVWSYLIIAGLVWFFDRLRRDLKKLGV